MTPWGTCLVPRRLSFDEIVRAWSLAVHHQSLAFRTGLCHAKNEAPEEEAAEVHYSISLINAVFIGYRFFIGWYSILILFMIMNSYGWELTSVIKPFLTWISFWPTTWTCTCQFCHHCFILCHVIGMEVGVSSGWCTEQWVWHHFYMWWSAVKSLYSHCNSSKTAWLGLLFVS